MRMLILMLLSAPQLFAQNAISECDQLYSKRGDLEINLKAIDCYKRLLEAEPQNFEAAWKLSKSYWYQGNHAAENKGTYFEDGIEAGKSAVSIDPKNCEGHFWLGVNYALYSENSSVFKALGIVDDVKKEMRAAMNLKNDCECGGPQRVLGKLYQRIPWFKGGSKSKSAKYLDESIQICPRDAQSRIFLAETYLAQNKKDLAREQLEIVLQQEPAAEWIPETKENKIKAKEMLNRLNKK